MPSNPLCSYCNIHTGMVYCRHYDSVRPATNQGEHGTICYACMTLVATGGMCAKCLDNFKKVHSKNHEHEKDDEKYQRWIFKQTGLG